MIVGGDREYAVGTSGIGMTDHFGQPHNDQPYKVLRVATKEEYMEDVVRTREAVGFRLPEGPVPDGWWFYEISVD